MLVRQDLIQTFPLELYKDNISVEGVIVLLSRDEVTFSMKTILCRG